MKLRSLRTAALAGALALQFAFAVAGTKEDVESDMKAGRWSQAEARLDKVLRQHPDNALAHYWMAQVEYELGKYPEAKAQAQQALAIDPAEKFTTQPKVLAKLLTAQGPAAAPNATAAPLTPAIPAAPVAPPPSRRGFPFGWMVALLLFGGLLWFFLRRTASGASAQEREQWKAALRQAHADLEDAVKASDAHPTLTPEVKLANYDRARSAQSAIAAHESQLASRRDFLETAQLVERSHDIAAEIRGEERPSLRRERMEQARAAQAPATLPQGAALGGGSSALRTAGAVGVGLAAGMLIEEAAEAATHRRQDFAPSFEAPPADLGGVDLGGSGDGGWDSGGGGDFDAGSGGDF